jgi:hypothetical protein
MVTLQADRSFTFEGEAKDTLLMLAQRTGKTPEEALVIVLRQALAAVKEKKQQSFSG